MHSQLVVLGGGPGGYAAAFLAADEGFSSVTLVEMEGRLGGTCLLKGCIPSKALLESTHLLETTTHDLTGHGIDVGKVSVDVGKMLSRKEGGVGYLIFNNPERHNAAPWQGADWVY